MGFRNNNNNDNFKRNHVREGTFIKKVLNQVSGGNMHISVKTVHVLTSIIRDITIKLVCESFQLLEMNNKRTLNAREIQTSVRLHLKGELAKHAVSEGIKQVSNSSLASNSNTLIIKTSYLKNKIKKMNTNYRISKNSLIYLSAVLEYLLAEILELSVNVARGENKKLITPRYIYLSIRNDEELNTLFDNNCIIPGGGVVPFLQFGNKYSKNNSIINGFGNLSIDDHPTPAPAAFGGGSGLGGAPIFGSATPTASAPAFNFGNGFGSNVSQSTTPASSFVFGGASNTGFTFPTNTQQPTFGEQTAPTGFGIKMVSKRV